MPKSPPHKKYGVITIAAAVAIIVAFLLAANGSVNRRKDYHQTIASQQHTDQVICQRVNKVYRIIQKQVRLSIKGTPEIAYYKSHPKDLAKVQKFQRTELKAFSPQPCPKAN